MRLQIVVVPLLVAVLAVACTADPVSLGKQQESTVPERPRNELLAGYSEVWQLSDAMADWAETVASLDTTQEGRSAALYYSVESPQICRDHFKALDLWWDGGHGLMSFHMDPPVLFVGYRAGTFQNSRGLFFRRAVYETIQESYATDPAGNQWRFRGRFNAVCRAGQYEYGPVVFSAQLVVAQNPIDKPILIRSACNSGGEPIYGWAEYDPYDPAHQDEGCDGQDEGSGGGGSGIPYQEGDYTNGETVDWNTGIGNGGVSSCGQAAQVEQICIEIWNDAGQRWDSFACGYCTTC